MLPRKNPDVENPKKLETKNWKKRETKN